MDDEAFEALEQRGVRGFLSELREELKADTCQPRPVRRVYIPKPAFTKSLVCTLITGCAVCYQWIVQPIGRHHLRVSQSTSCLALSAVDSRAIEIIDFDNPLIKDIWNSCLATIRIPGTSAIRD